MWDTAEGRRLRERDEQHVGWDLWGPYVSCRAWGTVREDYSADGDAWAFFPHDHARSRAYRWNEDGLAGICDDGQRLCFALALWNGRDAILKERPFGLSGPEGNHGEDAKDYWFHLDNTPSHAWMRMVYKYPQAAFPYEDLVATNAERSRLEPEYELVDTGVFDEGRYFDVEVTYAKAAVDDVVIRIDATNRGPVEAPLLVLPTLWFRNTWAWGRDGRRPELWQDRSVWSPVPTLTVRAAHVDLGEYELACAGADEVLFTENDTNTRRLFGQEPPSPYVKDAFHEAIVHGHLDAVNPAHRGTKAAAVHRLRIAAGATASLTLRLRRVDLAGALQDPFEGAEAVLKARRLEADELYAAVLPAELGDDARLVARQAFAGLLWSKQYYHYVVRDWLEGDPAMPPPPPERRHGRNAGWLHLYNADVISMPDTWEFPWYASWDLAFHCITFAYLDPGFAKRQLVLMLREWYMAPDGRVPAYEWNFDDVNPPVLAAAALYVFKVEQERHGGGDVAFLERVFHKLVMSFTWWVNREDQDGNNLFEGGFLGLDNIGPFDRSAPRLAGHALGQADGTAWMAFFAETMQAIALVLAQGDPVYEDMAVKFFEHSLEIAGALNGVGPSATGLWDDDDGFYYDALKGPSGEDRLVRARTAVGLVPMFGAFSFPVDGLVMFPEYSARRAWFLEHRPELADAAAPLDRPGAHGLVLRSAVPVARLRRLLERVFDPDELLSDYGVRAVSRYHLDHPLLIDVGGVEQQLDYEPGESTTDLFGGNSNWRGPVWMPINFLLIRALHDGYAPYFGADHLVELPRGSGAVMDLRAAAIELARRNVSIFLRGADGRRPVWGDVHLGQHDPHWRDLVPFHEYFHGDTGRGCGASHQTGWTALVAALLVQLGPEIEAASNGGGGPVPPGPGRAASP